MIPCWKFNPLGVQIYLLHCWDSACYLCSVWRLPHHKWTHFSSSHFAKVRTPCAHEKNSLDHPEVIPTGIDTNNSQQRSTASKGISFKTVWEFLLGNIPCTASTDRNTTPK
eukprot:1413510-Amphidinium_carterae.1